MDLDLYQPQALVVENCRPYEEYGHTQLIASEGTTGFQTYTNRVPSGEQRALLEYYPVYTSIRSAPNGNPVVAQDVSAMAFSCPGDLDPNNPDHKRQKDEAWHQNFMFKGITRTGVNWDVASNKADNPAIAVAIGGYHPCVNTGDRPIPPNHWVGIRLPDKPKELNTLETFPIAPEDLKSFAYGIDFSLIHTTQLYIDYLTEVYRPIARMLLHYDGNVPLNNLDGFVNFEDHFGARRNPANEGAVIPDSERVEELARRMAEGQAMRVRERHVDPPREGMDLNTEEGPNVYDTMVEHELKLGALYMTHTSSRVIGTSGGMFGNSNDIFMLNMSQQSMSLAHQLC